MALCQLSAQAGVQGREEACPRGQTTIVYAQVLIDRTSDGKALAECAKAGLVLTKEKVFVTVSPDVRKALDEWLDATAFPAT
jgi:hypothetical protein